MGCIFFFFKQKTAYEMRISDWSSDVCSSDLGKDEGGEGAGSGAPRAPGSPARQPRRRGHLCPRRGRGPVAVHPLERACRARCVPRVCWCGGRDIGRCQGTRAARPLQSQRRRSRTLCGRPRGRLSGRLARRGVGRMTATNTPRAARDGGGHRLLVRYMLLSLAAAVVTILLKVLATAITGSVGFLSDAMESGVNLVAAVVALLALRTAARPPAPVGCVLVGWLGGVGVG